MTEYKVTFRGKDVFVKQGTTYKEVSDLFKKDFTYEILVCCSNNSFVDLATEITSDCMIELYDRSSIVGNRVYSCSGIFILLVAIKNVLGPDAKLVCHHSQDKGIYCTIEKANINVDVLKRIEQEMHNIVRHNYLFKKITVSRMDAMKYFERHGYYDKANVLKYISNTYINLYKLNNIIGYFYGKVAYSTVAIDKFTLNYIADNGFVIQLPDLINPEVVLDYHHYDKVFEKFNSYTEWGKKLGIPHAAELNQYVSSGYVNNLIVLSEVYFNNQLAKVAQNIVNSKRRVILMAGPSSSGKTTTSKKLCVHLKSLGYNPFPISTDDFFVNIEDNPKDKNGHYDFECLEAIDIELFNKTLNQLLNEEEIHLPKYNFKTGKREYTKYTWKMGDNDIIIVEGIHALNETLTMTIDQKDKYKIYIAPLAQLNVDEHTHVHTSDVRKLRRIIRDNKTRNKSAEETLKMWANVSLGENNNIFPYQNNVDEVINSSLLYEIGVLKVYVEPLLFNVSENSSEYGEALRLINFLKNFLPIPADVIPTDSVIREFIGGSSFE